MEKISKKKIKEKINNHLLWLKDNDKGERLEFINSDLSGSNLSGSNLSGSNLRYSNLRGSDLRGSDLSGSNLSVSNLSGSNLSGSNLRYSDLSGSVLSGSDLRYSDLSGSDLRYSDLRYSDLSGSNLSGSNLSGSNLSGSNLRYSNLRGSDLRGSDLSGIIVDFNTIGYYLACPEEGSFIGYKKVNNRIVTLLITEDALRSSATTTKCRCSKAKVLSITDNNGQEYTEVSSNYDNNFIYKVGFNVEVTDFDTDRWNECSKGIHFFINKQNAIDY